MNHSLVYDNYIGLHQNNNEIRSHFIHYPNDSLQHLWDSFSCIWNTHFGTPNDLGSHKSTHREISKVKYS